MLSIQKSLNNTSELEKKIYNKNLLSNTNNSCTKETAHAPHARSVNVQIHRLSCVSRSEENIFSTGEYDAIAPIHPDDECSTRYESPEEVQQKLEQLREQQLEEQARLQVQRKLEERRRLLNQKLKNLQLLTVLKQLPRF